MNNPLTKKPTHNGPLKGGAGGAEFTHNATIVDVQLCFTSKENVSFPMDAFHGVAASFLHCTEKKSRSRHWFVFDFPSCEHHWGRRPLTGAILCGVCMFSPQVLRLPPTVQIMPFRLICDSKLTLGASVSVRGCLSRFSPCGPVMQWRPVQAVPRLFPL